MSVKKEEREGLGSSALFGSRGAECGSRQRRCSTISLHIFDAFPNAALRGIIPPQFGHLSSPRPRLTDGLTSLWWFDDGGLFAAWRFVASSSRSQLCNWWRRPLSSPSRVRLPREGRTATASAGEEKEGRGAQGEMKAASVACYVTGIRRRLTRRRRRRGCSLLFRRRAQLFNLMAGWTCGWTAELAGLPDGGRGLPWPRPWCWGRASIITTALH